MLTITGQIQDATGAALHATIDFVSKSTPLAGSGVVTTNTDARVLSNPSDGTFSIELAPGNYQVTIAANGQSSTFNIAVPPGSGSAAIDTLVTTPLVYPFVAPNAIWNGQWAGNITFQPMPVPPAPTAAQVAFAGGNINAIGDERYAYWVSYVTPTGETALSPILQSHNGSSPTANQANRIALVINPAGVTSVHIWRTYTDEGHSYDASKLPKDIGLLATVSPAVSFYDDWESTAEFVARAAATVPPLYNTTAGVLLSSNGTPCAFITDNGLFFPGCNCRVKPGFGLQVYNFTTTLWHTLIVSGNPAQLGLDAGNPS